MSESSMAIDTDVIVTFSDDDQNSVADTNTTISEIVTKFNAMLETATGHSHDGTDSPSISAGIGGLTMLELTVGRIMGGYE